MLRFNASYQRIKPMLVIVLAISILSLLGFASARKNHRQSQRRSKRHRSGHDERATIDGNGSISHPSKHNSAKILSVRPSLAYPISFVFVPHTQQKKDISITYPGNKIVHADSGISVLDASRRNNIPHMSMCGGRGRCSTCRIRVMSDLTHLPERNGIEQNIAKKLNWDDSIRLACQLHITNPIEVRPLVRSTSDKFTSDSRVV